jgi:predicted MFS family arabinose efflux permease
MSLTLIIGIFVAAALGGFVLLSFHLRSKPAPKALVIVHGLAAAVALVLLIVYAAQH